MSSRRLSIPHLLLTLALLLFSSLSIKGSPAPANTTSTSTGAATAGLFRPVGPVEYRAAMDTDASGDPFQLCLSCRCCSAADHSDCLVTACCFGIDCDLPDKPYGVCAFVPKVCNCTSCT